MIMMFHDEETENLKATPISQRNMVSLVNNFVVTSCNFLNEFFVRCETKFIALERKMQKIEASLIILESKLASIPDQNQEDDLEKGQAETKTDSAA